MGQQLPSMRSLASVIIYKIYKISLASRAGGFKQELSGIGQELTEIFFLNSNYQQ